VAAVAVLALVKPVIPALAGRQTTRIDVGVDAVGWWAVPGIRVTGRSEPGMYR